MSRSMRWHLRWPMRCLVGSADLKYGHYCVFQELQSVDLLELTDNNAKIAFWVNLYNILIIHSLVLYKAPNNLLSR